jgi:hypothetical protein
MNQREELIKHNPLENTHSPQARTRGHFWQMIGTSV